MINKELRGHPHQQSRNEIFTPPMPLNNVACYVCHNLGHVVARCRSRMVQDHHKRSSHPRYFRGYCFTCNAYGHKAIDCNRRNMKYVRCYSCNKLGHKARECRSKFQSSKQEDHTSSQFHKTELETERCDITQLAYITDTGDTESEEIQYSILHTLI